MRDGTENTGRLLATAIAPAEAEADGSPAAECRDDAPGTLAEEAALACVPSAVEASSPLLAVAITVAEAEDFFLWWPRRRK